MAKWTSHQRLVFATVYAAYATLYFTRKPLSVAKAAMTAEPEFTVALMGTIDTAFLVCYTIGNFFYGTFAARVPPGRLLSMILLLCSACTLAFSMTANPILMITAWSVNGFAQSLAAPACMSLLFDSFEESPNQVSK